jgi:hypothetical protein
MRPNDLTSYDLRRAKELAAQFDEVVEGDETIDIMLALALYSVFIAHSTDSESAKSALRWMQKCQDELLQIA